MIVKELIDLLQNCDPESELSVCYESDNPMDRSNSVEGVLEIKNIGENTTFVSVVME